MKRETVIDGIAVLLVLLFLYTALSKLMEWEVFQQQLSEQPVAREAVTWFAWGIPGVEIMACLLLTFQYTRRYGLWLSAGLMTIFSGYIGLVLLKVWEDVPCSCGGVIGSLGWGQHFLFNLVFTALAFAGLLLSLKRKEGAGSGELPLQVRRPTPVAAHKANECKR